MIERPNLMKASDLFVKQLAEEGVEYIFGLPGEETLDLLESLRTSNIKVVITRHEHAAAFMAATYGRLTGKAGVCFSTLGPGATNLVTGIAHAQLVGAPLIAIRGQQALQDNWQACFQMVDVVSLMRPITKSSTSIADPSTIPTVLRNAFNHAQAERPGAVHIELPEDVAEHQTDAKVQAKGRARRTVPSPKVVEEAANLINAAKTPLLIISGGANRSRVSAEVSEFARKTGIYAVHTQMGKGVLSDESEYSLFTTGMHKRDYVNCGIDRADVIITVGYSIIEYPPYVWNRELDKRIIHIDSQPAEVDRYYNPEVEVTGDISTSLRLLSGKITDRKDNAPLKSIREFLLDKLYPEFAQQHPPTPQEVVWHVRKALSPDDILTLDNGIYKLWFSRLYKTYEPNTFLLDNALATMGAGLPAGIAAKMLNPDKKVLSVVGDGGFMMNSQEIATALRYHIPIVVLILNDNAFGFVKWKQENMGLGSFGLELTNPDFAKFAESFGAVGVKIRKGDILSDVLGTAFTQNRPVVIECPIDYSVNYETFSKELGHLVCQI